MSRPLRTSGFTLLELIVASAITVLVTGATVVLLSNMTTGRDRVDRESRLQQEARAAAGAIGRALSNAHWTAEREQMHLEGEEDLRGELPSDRVRFLTVDRRQVRPGEPESDVKEVEFFLEPAGEGELPALMRRTDPALQDPPEGGGVVERVASNVVGLRVRYHDGERWQETWLAEADGWPVAMRVELLVVESEGGEVREVSRLVSFPYRRQGQMGNEAAGGDWGAGR